MTRKIFWENPYQANCETRISAVNGSKVELEETVFYALSGGQESDSGTIAEYPVIDARKTGKQIEYTLADDHRLEFGDSVTVNIDWPRRYRLMRLHFAAELVLELMCKELTGTNKIGAHIAEDKARIDFEWTENITPLLPQILLQATAIIETDGEIVSAYSDKADEKRYWKIAGFAKVPCGGTHLKSTGEVGTLRLKRKNIGKGKERVEIYLDSGSELN